MLLTPVQEAVTQPGAPPTERHDLLHRALVLAVELPLVQRHHHIADQAEEEKPAMPSLPCTQTLLRDAQPAAQRMPPAVGQRDRLHVGPPTPTLRIGSGAGLQAHPLGPFPEAARRPHPLPMRVQQRRVCVVPAYLWGR